MTTAKRKPRKTVLGKDAVAVIEHLALVNSEGIISLSRHLGIGQGRVVRALRKLKKIGLVSGGHPDE